MFERAGGAKAGEGQRKEVGSVSQLAAAVVATKYLPRNTQQQQHFLLQEHR